MSYAHTLSEREARELLRIARSTLREYLRSGLVPPGKPHRETMLAPAAVIATLWRDGRIRGRMRTEADTALYRSVQDAVVGAAAGRARRPPVSSDEIDRIRIEVAVLGPREVASGPEHVAIGTHGIAIAHEGASALLLPYVAVDDALDAEAFLARACQEAGLEAGEWRDPRARLEIFTAQVFREGEPGAA